MLIPTMAPLSISSQVSIKHCSLCPGTTEYYCHDCGDDLCTPCKEMHVDIMYIYHNVTVYRGKFNNSPRREMCLKHPDQVVELFCEVCDFPVCFRCKKHRQHKRQNIGAIYKKKRMHSNNIVINISCETLYNTQVLLTELKSDLTTSHKEIDQLKTAMLTMSKRLKDSMDNVQREISLKHKTLLISRLLKQKKQIKRNIANIQKYEHKYDKCANRPVEFLQFIKETLLLSIQNTPRLSQHCLLSLTQKFNLVDLIKPLSKINIIESKKPRRVENKLQMTLMPSPVLQKSLSVTGVNGCCHISCVTPDRVWISNHEDLTLIDIATGDKLCSLEYLLAAESGKHTVNSDRELIYIGKHYNISKLSDDMKTSTLLIDNRDPGWRPKCVYCSPSSGDLLVGMHTYGIYPHKGKVMRYNNTGKHTQTIPHNNSPHTLYRDPCYITENNNGDVVVSDLSGLNIGDVVVTSREGVHRFSYTGHPPRGVCTDALSNILVCNLRAVGMLSRDGEFLKYILTFPPLGNKADFPRSLSYDLHTHCLWVGSGPWFGIGQLSVYRHINRHPAILDPLPM